MYFSQQLYFSADLHMKNVNVFVFSMVSPAFMWCSQGSEPLTLSSLTMPDIILWIIVITHLGCHWSNTNLDIIIPHAEDTAHLWSPRLCSCEALQFSIHFLKYDSMQCNNSRCKLAMDLYQWHSNAFWFAFYYFLSGLPFTFLTNTKQWTDIFMTFVIQSIITHAVNRVIRDNLFPARWWWMQETIILCEVKNGGGEGVVHYLIYVYIEFYHTFCSSFMKSFCNSFQLGWSFCHHTLCTSPADL